MEISSAVYNEQGDNESPATSRKGSMLSMELQWLGIPDSALRFSLKSYLYRVNKHKIITFKLSAAIHKRIHYYRTAADIQCQSLFNTWYCAYRKTWSFKRHRLQFPKSWHLNKNNKPIRVHQKHFPAFSESGELDTSHISSEN